MADNKEQQRNNDELYTIVLEDQPAKGEKIPERTAYAVKRNDMAGKKLNIIKERQWDSDELYTITLEDEPVNGAKVPERTAFVGEPPQPNSKFYVKYGKPPSLTTASIIAGQAHFTPPIRNQTERKSFGEAAREYADRTYEKTDHIPFMCYFPGYEYMSDAQLNWYFYMRSCLRCGEYVDTDLSYIFVYIYELINQIGVNDPNDGLEKLIGIWIRYRSVHSKLDRYMVDWTSDYIGFYQCDIGKAFELLQKEGLFLLMPADMLMEYYLRNDMEMPLELIARFSDYKFYTGEFIKGEGGSIFIACLPGLAHRIRSHMNREKE